MYSLAGVFIACFLMQDRYHHHYGLLSSNTHGSQARIQKVLSKCGGLQKCRFSFALIIIFYRGERGSVPII